MSSETLGTAYGYTRTGTRHWLHLRHPSAQIGSTEQHVPDHNVTVMQESVRAQSKATTLRPSLMD